MLIDYAPTSLLQFTLKYKGFNYLHYLKNNFVKVALSMMLAVFLHLFLDIISHLDAYPYRIIGEYLFNSEKAGHFFYYLAMYFPPVFFSITGFYLLYKTMNEAVVLLPFLKAILFEKKSRNFIMYFIVFTIILGLIKLKITGIEDHFFIDSLVISLTNGLMISFFVTPTIFFLINKIKTLHG